MCPLKVFCFTDFVPKQSFLKQLIAARLVSWGLPNWRRKRRRRRRRKRRKRRGGGGGGEVCAPLGQDGRWAVDTWQSAGLPLLNKIPFKKDFPTKNGLNRDLNPGPLAPKARIIPLDHWAALASLSTISLPAGPSPVSQISPHATLASISWTPNQPIFVQKSALWEKALSNGNPRQLNTKRENISGSGGIRTHASEETGALNQRLRPLGHATLLIKLTWSTLSTWSGWSTWTCELGELFQFGHIC